jgi:biopolymer transport protein ExbB/TolQ
MDALIDILYTISTALLVPVMVALLALLGWSLLEVGGCLREGTERRRAAAHWSAFVASLSAEPSSDAAFAAKFFAGVDYPGYVGAFARRARSKYRGTALRAKVAADLEIEAAGRLAAMNFGVRVGPMLGLMGTLIPLGPALLGLSEENIDAMGRSLVVAFCTTVLGLLVGGLCYAMLLVRRQWSAQDLADIEFIEHCLSSTGVNHHAFHDGHEPQANAQPSPIAVHGG